VATFTIDSENNITAYATATEAAQCAEAGSATFDSQGAFAELSEEWPTSRLVEIWNSIPGNTEVKKFENRRKALGRIWKAIQGLAGATVEKVKSTKAAKPARKTKRAQEAAARKQPAKGAGEHTNKKAEIIVLMKRSKGATLAEIMAVTGWQAHTIRGFISILGRKGGERVESSKNVDGERKYKILK
jgi:hypothetical protein